VKAELNYGLYDSQVVRYFIHLLATSTDRQPGSDMRRAILLAAPDSWFEDSKAAPWQDFCDRYAGLARAFGITIGEIRLTDKLLIVNTQDLTRSS